MKKIMSIVLSLSLAFSACSLPTFAGSDRSTSSSKRNDTKVKRVIIRGEKMPAIIVNNEATSHSNARANAKATAGGNKMLKLIALCIKLGCATLLICYLKKILSQGKDYFYNSKDKIVEGIKNIILESKGNNAHDQTQINDLNENKKSAISILKEGFSSTVNFLSGFMLISQFIGGITYSPNTYEGKM